ncbi:transposase [Streptomyces sp. NPDC003006]
MITSVETDGEAIRVEARCTASGACCPTCGDWSAQVHGSYQRFSHRSGLWWSAVCPGAEGPPVRLRDPGLSAAHVRRAGTGTDQAPWSDHRASAVHDEQGRAGARRAGRCTPRRASGHRDQPQYAVAAGDGPARPGTDEPRAVGVDDFALRRGHVYGTVVIDAETHQVLDLLPGRDAATLAPWLAAHPGIEVICRDRAGAYAEAADTAAPQALQVADRFRLWQNLASAVEKTVAAHRSGLRDLPLPVSEPEPVWETPTGEAAGRDGETDAPTGKFAERAWMHHALVHELLAQGMSLRAVAQHLGWGRHTVQRYARAASWQDMVKGRKRQLPSKLDPFKPYLAARWAETGGRVTVLALFREITARGFRGHYSTICDWIRRDLPQREGLTLAPPPPSVRQVTGWLTRHPATLTEEEKLHRKAVLDRIPELASAAELTSSFAEMLTTLDGLRLPEWITEAMTVGLPGISTFAAGLESDFAAVTAGLTTDWNSGPVEGTVNRIKMLKRQMFGRAGFPLLRKRVLLA